MKNAMTQAEKDRRGWELRWKTTLKRDGSILRQMIQTAYSADEVYAQARKTFSAARCFQAMKERAK